MKYFKLWFKLKAWYLRQACWKPVNPTIKFKKNKK